MHHAPENDERTLTALRAARLYYLQDLTMEAIARDLNTSRSSVSRLLSYARETGLVDIRINSPLEVASRLEYEIRERFGVRTHAVPVRAIDSDVDKLDQVATVTAQILSGIIDSNMTIGIAWGSTISAVSRHLTRTPTHNSQIVQLNGAGNTSTTGIVYASEILRRFGDAFTAQVEQFPVPAFFDDPQAKRALWRERSTQRVLRLQRRLDVALFGIGAPFAEVPSRVYIGGYLEPEDYESLSRADVVGDVATVFFREDGSTGGIDLNERATGPDFETLRRTPRRVCVVSGVSKIRSLRGALAADLVTDLVLGEDTARALLDATD